MSYGKDCKIGMDGRCDEANTRIRAMGEIPTEENGANTNLHVSHATIRESEVDLDDPVERESTVRPTVVFGRSGAWIARFPTHGWRRGGGCPIPCLIGRILDGGIPSPISEQERGAQMDKRGGQPPRCVCNGSTPSNIPPEKIHVFELLFRTTDGESVDEALW